MTAAFAMLLMVLAQGAPAATPPAAARAVDPKVAAQVPLIAGKLRDWRGSWAAVGGKLGCKTLKTTGDSEIDLIGCQALIACIKPIYPELKAMADGAGSEADKKARMSAKLAGQNTCLSQQRGQGIAALALKRGRS